MRMFKGVFIASLISIILATAISFVPQQGMLTQPNDMVQDEDQPVTHTIKPLFLDKQELVTFLQPVPLYHTYQSLMIERHRLFIDLKVGDQVIEDHIYSDSVQLIAHLFGHTSNMDELYIKFVRDRDEQKVLVVSVNARRKHELMQILEERGNALDEERFLKNYTEIIYGTGWPDKEHSERPGATEPISSGLKDLNERSSIFN